MRNNQPLYYEQMLTLLNAFRPESRADAASVTKGIEEVVMRNAMANDGTDRKLDWFSITLCRVLAHNLIPGQHEGMPVDPFFVESLDERFAGDYPRIHRPDLINYSLHLVLGSMVTEPETSNREELLFLGLLARSALCCYMLEEVCADSGRDFDEELESFVNLAVEQLYYLRDQGQDFGGGMELPWHSTLN